MAQTAKEASRLPNHIQQAFKFKTVRISAMHVAEHAQRVYQPVWGEWLAANLNEDLLDIKLSYRDGIYWIMDGQHRIAACRLKGWSERTLTAKVWEGLTIEQEALMFGEFNHQLNVATYDNYTTGVTGGRHPEIDIEEIVRKLDLEVVAGQKSSNGVRAVGALYAAYEVGPEHLAVALQVIRDGYEGRTSAFRSSLIRALAEISAYYGSDFDPKLMSERLAKMRGGLDALLKKANGVKLTTGWTSRRPLCHVLVTTYNSNRRGRRLPTWKPPEEREDDAS